MANPAVPNGPLDDAVARRLRVFAEELAQQLGPAARVERGGTFAGAVDLLPARQDALPVSWDDFGDGLQLEAGTQGRWELDRTLQDVAFVQDVVRAIVAGRVREVLAPGRARIIVTMPDGTTEHETGYEAPVGCLPLPGWRWWGREVRYAPYAPGTTHQADRPWTGSGGWGELEVAMIRRRRDNELRAEAQAILRRQVERLRQTSYAELCAQLDEPQAFEVESPAGRVFQLEVLTFWDDKRARNLRVMVAIDDSMGVRIRDYLSAGFIMAPDGSFVGE
jgi:hypothetical protein